MKLYTIDDFLKYVYERDARTGNLAFRGQTNSEWQLIPSIHRGKLLRYQTMILETFLVYIFKDKNFDTSHIYTKQPVEFLAMCQHYGIPTRLLDISGDLLVSLFFACNSNKDKDGALFIIDRNKFSKLSSRNFRDTTEEAIIVDSNFINPRLRIQSGSFIIWGNRALDSNISRETYNLNEYLEYANKPEALQKITIPSSFKETILKELNDKYGINDEAILLQNQFSKRIEESYSKMKKIADILTYEITKNSEGPSLLHMNFAGCENLEAFPEEPMQGFSEIVKTLSKIVS